MRRTQFSANSSCGKSSFSRKAVSERIEQFEASSSCPSLVDQEPSYLPYISTTEKRRLSGIYNQ